LTGPAAAREAVLGRIADACHRAGRDPREVTLVAVSKTVPAAAVRALLQAGQPTFGENRVQEAVGKIAEVGPPARWHLVGHLQRNKARQAVGLFDLIHSVDDLDLVRELDRRAAARGVVQPVLVEVNLAGEGSKHGATEASLPSLLEGASAAGSLELRGLMAIPPPPLRPEDSRPFFRTLARLRREGERRLGRTLPDLSMGMSDDFEVAVEEEATLVRVGTLLFGTRHP
jgi:pyridoxal phosphate enzyme (YggS family)